jgi:hypothetical protein
MFSGARDTGLTPRGFVDQSRKQNRLSTCILVSHLLIFLSASITAVSGIGHKIKSVNNPDHRVELVKEYVMKHFPSHSLLDYALGVEKITTAKKDTVSFLAISIVIFQSDLGCSSSSTSMAVSPPALWTCSGTAVHSRKKRQMSILRSVSSPDLLSHYQTKVCARLARSMGFSYLVAALVSSATILTRIGSAHRCTDTLRMTSSLTWQMLHNHVSWRRWHRRMFLIYRNIPFSVPIM